MSSDESEEEEVMGERIGESEMEELAPEWGWRKIMAIFEFDEKIEGVDSRHKVKHNERSDQLCLEMIMTVAEQD